MCKLLLRFFFWNKLRLLQSRYHIKLRIITNIKADTINEQQKHDKLYHRYKMHRISCIVIYDSMFIRPHIMPTLVRNSINFSFVCTVCPKEVDNGFPIEGRTTIVTRRYGMLCRGWFQNGNYPRPRAAPIGKYKMSRVPNRDHDHQDHDPHDRWYLWGAGREDCSNDRKCR